MVGSCVVLLGDCFGTGDVIEEGLDTESKLVGSSFFLQPFKDKSIIMVIIHRKKLMYDFIRVSHLLPKTIMDYANWIDP